MTMPPVPQLSTPLMAMQDEEAISRAMDRAYEMCSKAGQSYFDALVKSHSGFRSLKPDQRKAQYQRLDLIHGSALLWLEQLSHICPSEARWTARDYRDLLGEVKASNGNGAY